MSPVRAGASAVTVRSPSSSTPARSGSVATLSLAWRVRYNPDWRDSWAPARTRIRRRGLGGGVEMARFPKNDIISLIGETPRYDLGDSVGHDLRLNAVLDPSCQSCFGEI